MAHSKFLVCLILMFNLFPMSEPRLVNPSGSYKPAVLDAKEVFHMVSVFKGTNKNPRRLRASPGGPDPAHH
ncbi:hypothetical protein FH972_000575 [Carpinus fangiana]|uniref:CLAVATA3/ESR-like protein n=1 Tax=Carpinus fangiana TaxID=176857 RepID=A0A5N6Q984_9ROSI|nr:hypothetical protein FH972_000575 [Carpinus fangiana]